MKKTMTNGEHFRFVRVLFNRKKRKKKRNGKYVGVMRREPHKEKLENWVIHEFMKMTQDNES